MCQKHILKNPTILSINNFDDATALVYYSMYYSVLALFFKCGIKCENHSASIILLKELFDLDNQKIIKAKKERIDKQYYVDFHASKSDVKEGISIAEEFNSIITDHISRLNNDSINNIRNKFINFKK
jgi:uncharacterized protein (UPF0332 family)